MGFFGGRAPEKNVRQRGVIQEMKDQEGGHPKKVENSFILFNKRWPTQIQLSSVR